MTLQEEQEQIIRGAFAHSDDCVCLSADESYDGKDHKCALHRAIQSAEVALQSIKDERYQLTIVLRQLVEALDHVKIAVSFGGIEAVTARKQLEQALSNAKEVVGLDLDG